MGRTADNGFIEPTVPTVSVADAEASEGETLNFAVTLSTAHSAAVTVDYATSDGTAVAGEDYTAESGTLNFAPGETAKTVAVAVLTDTDPEGTETVTLTLSNATGATIAASAATGRVTDVSTVTRFTAAFGSFPPEHNGSTKFTLHLRFSEEPAEMSYKTVRDTLFNVTGGEVKKARRLNAPSNQGFEITIKPAGNGAATLELATGLPACGASGSVCAPDGRRLEGPLTVTVPGPVAISVADAEVDEEPGAKLAFVVTLARASAQRSPNGQPHRVGGSRGRCGGVPIWPCAPTRALQSDIWINMRLEPLQEMGPVRNVELTITSKLDCWVPPPGDSHRPDRHRP